MPQRFPTRLFSTTDTGNESISASNTILFKEGQLPGTVNNSARSLMSALRLQKEYGQWFDYGDDPTRTSATKFTLAGNLTDRYHAGRRIWVMDAGNDYYGEITAVTFSANTEVTLALDSGSLTASLSAVALAILTNINSSLPGRASQAGRRININGDLRIAQRGAGTTILTGFDSTTNSYFADQFLATGGGTPQNRASLIHSTSGGPTGFPNYIRYDITTAEAAVAAGEYSLLQTRIEKNKILGLEWGAATAKSLTLTFRVRSPKTGTHCVALYAGDANKSYVVEYTVSAADTWETKSVTFAGETGTVIPVGTGELRRMSTTRKRAS